MSKISIVMTKGSVNALSSPVNGVRDSDSSFSQIMEQSNEAQKDMSVDSKQINTTNSTNDNNIQKSDSKDANDVQDNTDRIPLAKQSDEVKEPEEEITSQELETVEQEIEAVVSKVLNLDPEEYAQLLADLGITSLQLLNPEQLQQLVIVADGGTDAMDLLTNEQMMMDFASLTESLQNISENVVQMPLEQLQQFLQEMEVVSESADESEIALLQEGLEEEVVSNQTQNTDVVSDNSTMEQSISVTVEKETDHKTVPLKESNPQDVTESEQSDSVVSVQFEEASTNGESSETFDFSQSQQNTWESEDVQTANEPVEVFVNPNLAQNQNVDTTMDANLMPRQVQMVRIVEQVVEQIRMNISVDVTTMEMQLNPENLGRVLLAVSTKDGVMTAQFTVQSQEAQEALQSQMYELKETLEQRELKVDAIEINISDFDLSQSNHQDDQKNMEHGDGRARKFNLEGDEEISAQEEAEQVRQNVMRDQGTSIDFTA